MSDNKIKKSIDNIEPEDGAKERMYQNILKKAELQSTPLEEPKKQNKRPAKFIRYALPIAACFCLLVFGAVKFIPKDTPINPDESLMQGGNPFATVESADDFEALSIKLDAPLGAEEISYAVIDGKIAEVRFRMNQKSFLARASSQSGDFSGINGEELSPETIDAKNNAVLSTVKTNGAVYCKIVWTDGKTNYCLYGTDGADKDLVLSVYEALKNK